MTTVLSKVFVGGHGLGHAFVSKVFFSLSYVVHQDSSSLICFKMFCSQCKMFFEDEQQVRKLDLSFEFRALNKSLPVFGEVYWWFLLIVQENFSSSTTETCITGFIFLPIGWQFWS